MSVEVDGWSNDPDEWPHTPPLSVVKRLLDRDYDMLYRLPAGDMWNLLEEALALLYPDTQYIPAQVEKKILEDPELRAKVKASFESGEEPIPLKPRPDIVAPPYLKD